MERIEKRDNSFEELVRIYLEKGPDRVNLAKVNMSSELEVRFNVVKEAEGLNKKALSKDDYDNVVKELYAAGFAPHQGDIKGKQLMRIYKEGLHDTRVELAGTDTIQDYCRSNDIRTLLENPKHNEKDKVTLTKKTEPRDAAGDPVRYVDNREYRFRVSYKMEENTPLLSAASLKEGEVARAVVDWKEKRKTFRYMNRVRFSHPDLPVFADLTILKMSKTPDFTLQESNVLNALPTYEVELEVDNSRTGITPEALLAALRKAIRVVLQALQKTPYPVSYREQDDVLKEYLLMTHHGKRGWEEIRWDKKADRAVTDWSRFFAGPSSRTLQWDNLRPVADSGPDSGSAISVRHNYTVTDKADGDRKMLYISSTGKVYTMDVNMNIAFTGSTVEDKTLHRTLLDGEHILLDKEREDINLFACFDVYYIAGKNCRCLPFVKVAGEEDLEDARYRLFNLESICARLTVYNSEYKVQSTRNYLKIRCKQFYTERVGFSSSAVGSLIPVNTIFEGCKKLLQAGMQFDYETDGLIFTPCKSGVLGCKEHDDVVFKSTWAESFKWKPPHYNTIDFMVRMVKDKSGKDLVITEADGANYKMASLWCGYNPSRDLKNYYCEYVLEDLLPERGSENYKQKPMRFIPSSEPYDADAYFCKLPVTETAPNVYLTRTVSADKEPFDENTIVEFRYDLSEEDKRLRWKPIRVRTDKTEQLRQFKNNFGNAYHVCNDNWYSIHHPITEAMLSGKDPVPNPSQGDVEDGVYYIRSGAADERIREKTRGLRDFHNKYVKSRLIQCAASMAAGLKGNGRILLDIAVGLGGDLHKWVDAGIQFVVGIDSAQNNLTSPLDGACKRMIEWRTRHPSRPFRAVFLHGDGGKNIQSGDAFPSDSKGRKIMQCLGGHTKDVEYKMVQSKFGIAKNGFGIVSCQFAMHYFFESKRSLNEFVRNLCENTTEGGYFIGTCYDGHTVFNWLSGRGMPIVGTYPHPDTKEPVEMYRIEKRYTQDAFKPDATSLGYKIDVYQETIGKVFPEYLVNFEYFMKLMSEYGFDLADKAKTREFGVGLPTGMFADLFDAMVEDSVEYGSAARMSAPERALSFMNRYFIFRKNRMASAELVFNNQMALPTEAAEGEGEVQALSHVQDSEFVAAEPPVTNLATNIAKVSTAATQVGEGVPVKRVDRRYKSAKSLRYANTIKNMLT